MAQARTDGKELYILPGSYNLGFTAIAPGGTPGTRPIRIYATPRTVTLNFTADDLFFWIENISDVEIEGIDFDGKNRALSGFPRPGLVTAVGASNLVFRNCRFLNSTQVGVRLQDWVLESSRRDRRRPRRIQLRKGMPERRGEVGRRSGASDLRRIGRMSWDGRKTRAR